MTVEFKNKIISLSGKLGISITEHTASMLYRYYEMLIEKNKVMNLTAITEENEVITKHFIDSLSLVKCLDIAQYDTLKIIDVGTGAGFPGLVLKIVFPEINISLFDSLKKRLVFLDEVINELNLDNVETIHGRAEDFGHDPVYREKYDIAVSRAVANMSSLSEYCLPFVKKGGLFIAYKSKDSAVEVEAATSAIAKLGGRVERNVIFTLPDSDIDRCLTVVSKIKNTSSRYPRKAGIPSKEPLK